MALGRIESIVAHAGALLTLDRIDEAAAFLAEIGPRQAALPDDPGCRDLAQPRAEAGPYAQHAGRCRRCLTNRLLQAEISERAWWCFGTAAEDRAGADDEAVLGAFRGRVVQVNPEDRVKDEAKPERADDDGAPVDEQPPDPIE